MAPKRNRYKDLESVMTIAVIADACLFAAYLLAAGNGVTWLKITLAIIAILGSVLALAYLFLTKELLRRRSFWMTIGFAAVILCTVVSLLCSYPSPNELAPSGGLDPAAVGMILLP